MVLDGPRTLLFGFHGVMEIISVILWDADRRGPQRLVLDADGDGQVGEAVRAAFASWLACPLQSDALVAAVAVVIVPRACGSQAWEGGLEAAAEGLLGAVLLAADASPHAHHV